MKLLVFILIFTQMAFASLKDEVTVTAELRRDVELLSQEIEAIKKTQQAELDIYIQRHQEVTSLTLKEKFREDQLKTQIKLGKEKLETHSKKVLSKGSDTWLIEFWKNYEVSLKEAHPLYAPKLLERFHKLKIDFQFKKLSYEHALLQTWFILESDLNKSQDAEFVLSPLQIDEKLFHVEMVRFGRSKGYFRTADGKYGILSFDKKWQMTFFDDSKDKEKIEILLAQFKQQQKTGLYQLPGIKL
jgi:hypothetical protein